MKHNVPAPERDHTHQDATDAALHSENAVVRRVSIFAGLAFSIGLVSCANNSGNASASRTMESRPATTASSPDSAPIALSVETSAELRSLISLAGSLQARTPPPAQSGIPAQLQEYATSQRGQLFVAEAYIVDGDYGKGLGKLHELLNHAPLAADVHEALGDAYCDLAILDLMNRRLYKQTPGGFFLFLPDAKTKPVLLASKIEFDTAAGLGSTRGADRAKNVQNYLDGDSDLAVTEDQARADQWLLKLGGAEDSLRRNLDAFKWELILQKPPVMLGSTLSQLRDQNFVRFRRLGHARNVAILEGVNDLGYSMSTWTIIWLAYQTMKRGGGSVSEYSQMLKDIGGQIEQYAEGLSVTLSPDEAKILRLENDDLTAFRSLNLTIENEVGARHGQRYRQLYGVAYSAVTSVTILETPVFSMLKPLAASGVATLNRLSSDLSIEPLSEDRADSPNEVANQCGRLVDVILAELTISEN